MRRLRFRDRLLISFFAVAILPFLLLGVLAPVLSSRTVGDLSASYTRELVASVTANLELMIREQEKLLELVLRDDSLERFYAGPDVRPGSGPSRTRLTALFESVGESHPEITGMIAVSRDDRSFSTTLERIVRDPLVVEEWYERARAADRDFVLVTRPIGRNLRNVAGVGSDEIVSLVKTVYRPESREFAGVLMTDLDLRFFEASFAGTLEDDTAFFLIVDGTGEVVYAPTNPIVYRINPDWFTDSDRIVERTIDTRGYRFIFAESPYMGWKTIGVYYLDEALQPVRFVQLTALVIGLFTIALTVVIAFVYSRAITKPVLSLLAVMEDAGHGDLTVRYDGASADEIDQLGRGLNSMLERIQSLLDLVYREQQSKREAELRILQQQIKPHFLYNTLDTILWMAEEKGADDIGEVVTALTRLFRVALSQGREIISLSDEMEHVRSYLTIQKIRYEEKFDFRIDCPSELLSLHVQKMILQPIVENSIYHGVKEKEGRGVIAVSVSRRDEELELVVSDNGVGMPAEIRHRINEGLHLLDHGTDRTAFALYNVNDRIRLTYGERYGISIDAAEGTGTVVTIVHPVVSGAR